MSFEFFYIAVNVTVEVLNVNKDVAELVNSFNQLIASRCVL